MDANITMSQLSNLEVTPSEFEALLAGHQQLVDLYLAEERLQKALAYPEGNVLGVGITENAEKGHANGRPALLLLVDRLPAGGGLPRHSPQGMPILHEEVGQIRPTAGYRGTNRPVPGGVSIAPCAALYSGTLGCLVESNKRKYILSNCHVLADEGALPLGSTASQPSTGDGGACPIDVIADLSFFVPLNIGGISTVDAAISACARGVNFDARILRDNNAVEKLVPPVVQPKLGLEVQKSGRTTGHTKGKVTAVALTIVVPYTAGQTTFHNVFSVQHVSGQFSRPGDSGSLISTQPGNQPMGLLFAGDTLDKNTYAHPLSEVLTQLAGQTGYTVDVVY
jgi:hypothetical protein